MAAIEIEAPGPPDVLRLVRRAVPRPGANDVLLRVAAAGVNRPDLLQRAGLYPPPPGASDLPGLEVAGTVVEAGAEVASWRVGDAVTALVSGGGYAEYCVAPAVQCLPVPRGLDLAEAASLPETFFTVWTNVFERGRLGAGETLLVHGGSSGIGTAAIQMARVFGARVLVTAGTPEKCAACVSLGATRAMDYRREDFVAGVREATEGRGADVVLDMVGAPYLARNLECLAPEGRLVQIGVQQGPKAEVDLRLVMRKGLTLTGSTLRPRPVEEKGRIAAALREKVWPHVEAGAIRPVIHARLPLAEAREAHRTLEASRHIGKLVLIM
jgi:putative PIG3 family NAD(P)H quinone oxidoreductase